MPQVNGSSLDVMAVYPDDADGDALRRIASDGSDMTQPMSIDFAVAVPDREAGIAIARSAEEAGYVASLAQDNTDKTWTCYCKKVMVATYEAVVDAQAQLGALAEEHGGSTDGWGTFGNCDTKVNESEA